LRQEAHGAQHRETFLSGISSGADRNERREGPLEWLMLVAWLLVIPAIAIEHSDVGEPWDTVAALIDWAAWLAFLAEARTCSASWPAAAMASRSSPGVAIVLLRRLNLSRTI
jgi:hypothetical protein